MTRCLKNGEQANPEYAAKKQSLISEKMSLTEKITDFETKGLSWLEPAREFVKSLNQAANLIQTDNLSELPTFLKNIGSNHILRNREFLFAPKNPYNLVAERRVSRREALTFPTWCRRRDLNSQAFRHTVLNRTCIPISPLRRKAHGGQVCQWSLPHIIRPRRIGAGAPAHALILP